MNFSLSKQEEEKKPIKPFCQWCGHDIPDGQYSFASNYTVFKGSLSRIFYFDTDECLSNWIKGIIEAKKAN